MIIKLNKKHGNISEQFIFYTLDASNVNKITEITDNFSINLFKQENKPRKQIGLMLKFDRFPPSGLTTLPLAKSLSQAAEKFNFPSRSELPSLRLIPFIKDCRYFAFTSCTE